MLSDEEREALEILNNTEWDGFMITIKNLIEKQSKEIEELKNGQIDFWISDKEIEERIRNKFVSKDKIKAIIEEIKSRKIANEEIKQAIIDILQSLLEKE